MDIVQRYDELWKERIKWIERLKIINNEYARSYDESEKWLHVLSQFVSRKKKTYFERIAQDKWTKPSNIKEVWDKTKSHSVKIVNDEFFIGDTNVSEKFEDICKKWIEPVSLKVEKKEKWKNMLQVVISDSHLWMDVNPKWNWLFKYEYSADIYMENMQKIFNNISAEYRKWGKFDKLVISDLWDREDWFWAETTRGGHTLEQNMTEWEVFDVCVKAKTQLIGSLLKENFADEIIIRDILNSNHTSSFADIVTRGTKSLVEALYGNSVYIVLWRIIWHSGATEDINLCTLIEKMLSINLKACH